MLSVQNDSVCLGWDLGSKVVVAVHATLGYIMASSVRIDFSSTLFVFSLVHIGYIGCTTDTVLKAAVGESGGSNHIAEQNRATA